MLKANFNFLFLLVFLRIENTTLKLEQLKWDGKISMDKRKKTTKKPNPWIVSICANFLRWNSIKPNEIFSSTRWMECSWQLQMEFPFNQKKHSERKQLWVSFMCATLFACIIVAVVPFFLAFLFQSLFMLMCVCCHSFHLEMQKKDNNR